LEGFDGDDADRLNQLWLETWSQYLAKLPSGLMNWFFPRELGGFGLRATRDVVSNEGQRHAAAWLRDNVQAEVALKSKPFEMSPARVVTTTVHEDAEAVYKQLSVLGYIEKAWVSKDPDSPLVRPEFSLPGLETVCGISGFSSLASSLTPKMLERADLLDMITAEAKGRPPVLTSTRVASAEFQRFQPTIVSTGDYLHGVKWTSSKKTWAELAPKDQEEAKWLSSARVGLRKAARSTGREMPIEDIVSWDNRKVGWVLVNGTRFVKGMAPAVKVRTGKIIGMESPHSRASDFGEAQVTGPVLLARRGPVLLIEDVHSANEALATMMDPRVSRDLSTDAMRGSGHLASLMKRLLSEPKTLALSNRADETGLSSHPGQLMELLTEVSDMLSGKWKRPVMVPSAV